MFSNRDALTGRPCFGSSTLMTEQTGARFRPRLSAGNSLLRDPRQLHRGALPGTVSLDEDIRETKFPADLVAIVAALDHRAARYHRGIVIDTYRLVVVGDG